jgi:hypothetical protein
MNEKQKRFQHIESAVPTNKSVFNSQSLVNRDRVTRSMTESPSSDDVWTNENNSIQTSMPQAQVSDMLKDENNSIRTGNNENQETPLNCAAINSNGGEIKCHPGSCIHDLYFEQKTEFLCKLCHKAMCLWHLGCFFRSQFTQ